MATDPYLGYDPAEEQNLIPPNPQAGIGYYGTEKLKSILLEMAKRKAESLRLYEPLPMSEKFHASKTKEKLARGSNRASKTLTACVEVARAACGCDPFDKYEKEGGRIIAVGKDGKHCADPMWRKLSRSGAFRMIRDLETGLWRAYRPWTLTDMSRERESKPAPPLIPTRMIKSIAWENKKLNQPALVVMKNGWEILFKSSEGKPPQGVEADLVWFDEEIVDNQWYPEMSARLLDRNGRFIWSATPQAGTQHLYDLHCRALDKDKLVEEFLFLLKDNPHLSQQAKDDLASKLSPEERRVRIDGEFAISGYKVYPEFSVSIHGVKWFQVPENWTRYAAVDPGRQVCAVLFMAIPPDQDSVYLYDELYIRNCDADKFGEQMSIKCGQHQFQVFIIDGQAARVGEIGSGQTIEQQYTRGLKDNRVRSILNGYGFTYGSNDPQAGELAVRKWLRIRKDGTTKLRIIMQGGSEVETVCPNFQWEIERYHFKRVGGMVTDRPEQKNCHLMDTLRYLIMYEPKYVEHKPGKRAEPYAVRALRMKRERKYAKHGPSHIRLGPGREK